MGRAYAIAKDVLSIGNSLKKVCIDAFGFSEDSDLKYDEEDPRIAE